MRLMRRLVGTLRCAHATSTHSASSSLDGEESHAAPPRQGGPPKIYFPIPSVLDSMDLPGFARRHGAQLRSDIETEMLALSRTDGPFMKQCIQEELDAAFAPLLTLKRLEVEDYVKRGRHKLDVEGSMLSCLVPYQLAANLILTALPRHIAEVAVAQLSEEERALKHDAPEFRRGFLLNHVISEYLPKRDDEVQHSNSDPVTGQAAWFDLTVSIEPCGPETHDETSPRPAANPLRVRWAAENS